MHRHLQPTMNRRRFIRSAGALGAGGAGVATADESTEEPAWDTVDDEGNVIDPAIGSMERMRAMGARLLTIAPASGPGAPPDGRIVSGRYRWIEPGSPRTGNRYALRIADRGGVDIGFRFVTPDDLTIDTQFRFHGGRDLAYLFNDVDSIRSGFRAFTNGQARRGLFFRNPFGGHDFGYRGNVQDGKWHWLRIVLDAEAREFAAFLDGNRIGRSRYNGNGWTSLRNFRVMGRRSGSSTQMEYDRFVMTNRAIYPEEAEFITSSMLHYELEEGSGTTLANRPTERISTLIDRKRDLIDEIRETSDRLLPTTEVNRLDRRAETVLDAIEDDGSIATGGARNALSRLVAAEEVTLCAARSGVEPARRTAGTVVTLAKSLAVGRLAKRALRIASWAGRRLRSMLSDLVSRVRRTVDSLLARPVLAPAVRRRIDEVIGEVDELVGEYVDEHGETLVGVGETLMKTPIEVAVEKLSEPARSDLDRIRSNATEVLATTIYDRYQFAPGADAPGTSEFGINHAIERAVEPIASILATGEGSIEFDRDGGIDPEELRDEVVAEIQRSEAQFLEAIDASEAASEAASTFSLVVAIIALGAFAIAVAAGSTGIGLVAGVTAAVIGANLRLYAAILGGISVLLTAGSTVIGVEYLRRTRSLHADTVATMLELRGVMEGSA